MKSAGKVSSYSMNRSKQSGIVMVIGMIAMVALLAMAGLAMDSGHMLINKTRLQNTADAAALHAAKVYDLTSDIGKAQTAVTTAINLNGDMPGQKEMKDAIADGTIKVDTEFSNTLNPFTPGALASDSPWFIRVTMTNFRMPAYLVRVVGVNTLTVSASAVSGPSPKLSQHICDLAPVLLCGAPDLDPDDGVHFGYGVGTVVGLKHGSDKAPTVGSGNFQLVRLPSSSGGSDITVNMAGGYDSNNCTNVGQVLYTEPGGKVGPVMDGLDTRFGIYGGVIKKGGAALYPGDPVLTEPDPRLAWENNKQDPTLDKIVFEGSNDPPFIDHDSLSFNYDKYETANSSFDGSEIGFHRRIITVPVAECPGDTHGSKPITIIGLACVYLVQRSVHTGPDNSIFVQIVDDCSSDGNFGMDPVTGPLPTRIILYKDTSRVDS